MKPASGWKKNGIARNGRQNFTHCLHEINHNNIWKKNTIKLFIILYKVTSIYCYLCVYFVVAVVCLCVLFGVITGKWMWVCVFVIEWSKENYVAPNAAFSISLDGNQSKYVLRILSILFSSYSPNASNYFISEKIDIHKKIIY